MAIILNLKPEVESGLQAQARAKGMTLEEYLLSMVEGAVLTDPKTLSAEQRVAAFEKWAAGHQPNPPLPDHAVSREAMYEGHDGQ